MTQESLQGHDCRGQGNVTHQSDGVSISPLSPNGMTMESCSMDPFYQNQERQHFLFGENMVRPWFASGPHGGRPRSIQLPGPVAAGGPIVAHRRLDFDAFRATQGL